MTSIKSDLTRIQAAEKIVAELKDHYQRVGSDIVIGFNEHGTVDFDYLVGTQKSVVVAYFATNNGFTFNPDEDPREDGYWHEEEKHSYLVDYITEELKAFEFDGLLEFA